jgi:hypothetical protein
MVMPFNNTYLETERKLANRPIFETQHQASFFGRWFQRESWSYPEGGNSLYHHAEMNSNLILSYAIRISLVPITRKPKYFQYLFSDIISPGL